MLVSLVAPFRLSLIKSLLVLAVVFFLVIACQGPKPVSLPPAAASAAFPEMSVQNLSGEILALPSQFPGERTLLMVAYEQKQQAALDDWSARLKLKSPGAPEWLELPIITNPGALMRSVIDNGMRSGIPDKAVRDRVFTIYTPREEFNQRVGLSDMKVVHLLVADRKGRLLAKVSGGWTAQKEAVLRLALKAGANQ
jgi:hypothetical protein